MNPMTKIYRLLVFVLLVWSMTLFMALYTLRNVWMDDTSGELRCTHIQQQNSSTFRDWILKSGNWWSGVRKDNLMTYQNMSTNQLHHKKFWPSTAEPQDYGYGGRGVVINPSSLNAREKQIFDMGYKTYRVNKLASDMIPMRREIHLNMPECSYVQYDTSLPRAGVVLIFHNELWSLLLRTVFSILDAGPDHLITEVILVDDASDKEYLGRPLEDYLIIFNGKVKLVRLPERKGLIQARMVGFDHVTAEVAVFLDAHCEVHKGWLEPLLQRIKENDSVLAVPTTDSLNWVTFEFEFKDNTHQQRGGFDFDMNFDWIEPNPIVKRRNLVEPVMSPTHMGCCFAVSKNTFERLGRYDPDLKIWGCENLELSFKIWMCGGSVEIIPCSHVAHMYRTSFPYSWGKNASFTLIRNCLRVAEVWLDEYKQFFYERIGQLQTQLDIGDIQSRRALRENLKCRSFDWYVKEIYPDLYVPINTSASGLISNKADRKVCLSWDMYSEGIFNSPVPSYCRQSVNLQHFILTKEGQIRRDKGCLTFDKDLKHVIGNFCLDDDSKWLYTKENKIVTESGLCLTLTDNKKKIIMAACRKHSLHQQWIWPRISVVLH